MEDQLPQLQQSAPIGIRGLATAGIVGLIGATLNTLAWIRFELGNTAAAAQNAADAVAMYERLFPERAMQVGR
ncbi:MAG: hypothetical protein EXS17_00940 [Phycisphaerales bacterium]|nr:hypothetical protein [Phycisphaerales bacterium]